MFIQCFVDPDALPELEALRPAHLEYVRAHGPSLAYGGVVETPQRDYQQICYFLRASSVESAGKFIAQDPFHPCYAKVEIHPFTQKVPKDSRESDT